MVLMRPFHLPKILLTGLLIFASAVAVAQPVPLSDFSYLRKLSLHIQGVPPSKADYQALTKAKRENKTPEFFDSVISTYLVSPGHQAKMTIRLEESFRLTTSTVRPRLPGETPLPQYQNPYGNMLNDLFLRMTKENLSWDSLLTEKNYAAFSNSNFSGGGDYSFLKAILPQIIPDKVPDTISPPGGGQPPEPAPIAISFAGDDARVAGALTTARFFRRYGTTQLNKNRKRAAAVFNIFLCDPMSAAIPDRPASPDDDLGRAFPDTSTITEGDIKRSVATNDRHGGDQACAKCHYKLDPAGQTFMTSTLVLSPIASPGRLTYRDQKTGVLIDQPVAGLGGLGEALVKQDQYVRCQVDRLWTWFVGEDRPLNEAREKEIIAEFNRVGRKTNDFVRVLVSTPEFKTRDLRTESEIMAGQVKGVLKNCASCHGEQIPDFAKWPIGGSSADMSKWVARIGDRLDLEHDGASRDMPPPRSPWQPTVDDLHLLKAWVGLGAPDEKGNRQL